MCYKNRTLTTQKTKQSVYEGHDDSTTDESYIKKISPVLYKIPFIPLGSYFLPCLQYTNAHFCGNVIVISSGLSAISSGLRSCLYVTAFWTSDDILCNCNVWFSMVLYSLRNIPTTVCVAWFVYNDLQPLETIVFKWCYNIRPNYLLCHGNIRV